MSFPEFSKDSPSGQKPLAETLLSGAILEAIPDAVVAVSQAGVILQVNSQTEAMFGYPRGELIGQAIEILVPKGQRERHHSHRADFHQKPKIRRMGSGLDLIGMRRDGSTFPVEISLSPVALGDSTTMVLSVIRDISDSKRIEAELRRANDELARQKSKDLRDHQARMALIVDSSQDAIIGKTLDGIVTHWNSGAEQMYGYTAGEILGKSISILAPPDKAGEIDGILRKIRQGIRVDYFESIRLRKDGSRLNVSISVSPIADENGQIVGASTIARNITSQKKIEDQFRQSQKMEAVGRLAGGVAHDFNNLLGIVSACTELLRSRTDNPEHLEYLDNIREASKRGADLTRQLLSFSRKRPVQTQLMNLNDRLTEVSRLLRPLMGDDVEVSLIPRTPSAIIEADPGQIDQVVMNLAVNARDAMPKGGRLVIETAVFDFDEVFAREHPAMSAGRYVMMAVSDNGIGMDEGTLSRIFEPFFTTKDGPATQGLGLGLSISQRILERMGGSIEFETVSGRGSVFHITFPRCPPSPDRAGFPG
jgi:two-component system cell cycle sensor histidine kinase/response regulator CckA